MSSSVGGDLVIGRSSEKCKIDMQQAEIEKLQAELVDQKKLFAEHKIEYDRLLETVAKIAALSKEVFKA